MVVPNLIFLRSRLGFAHILPFVAAPAVWLMHFVLLYGAETLACRTENGPAIMLWSGAVATIIALGTLAFMAHQARKSSISADVDSFRRNVVMTLALLSSVAVLWTASTLLFVEGCTAT